VREGMRQTGREGERERSGRGENTHSIQSWIRRVAAVAT
jgi:hypothetical protein